MFQPLKVGEEFHFERLCKCKCEEHAKRRKKCKDWIKVNGKAFKKVVDYFLRFDQRIFTLGIVELDYAFYRIVRHE